jgi:hypothetical protein
MFPTAHDLDWLAERLDPEKERPFVGYQAAIGLLQAVRGLPSTNCAALRKAVDKARGLAERLPDDPPRIEVLKSAADELKEKCSGGTSSS